MTTCYQLAFATDEEHPAEWDNIRPQWIELMEQRAVGRDNRMEFLFCPYYGGMFSCNNFDPSVRTKPMEQRWSLHYSTHAKRKRDGFCNVHELHVKSIMAWPAIRNISL